MRLISMVDNDGVNSLTGFTTSIFFAGCEHRCKGCFSEKTWNWNNGNDYSFDDIKGIILNSRCKNVSIIGGDVFFPKNREDGINLIKWIKEKTDKTLYVWTGYTKEDVENWIDISLIDFLMTDKFELDKLNLKLLLRGSGNQRIFCNGVEMSDDEIIKNILTK